MYLTQSNVIRGLSKQDYAMLREMCQYSNNLYNVAVYTIRQHYFDTHQFLRYEENYPICKENENYSLLQAGVAQQILKIADRSFRSFFGLLQKVKVGDYQSKDVRLPHYREKGGWFHLVLSTNAINIKNGFLICPMYGGRYFKIQYCYLKDPEPVKASSDRVLAIDLGLDNLAACVTNTGTSFLMDGRKLKSINQYWNKRKARLQSIAAKQGRKTTNQLCQLAKKRNFRMQDILRKTARYILDFCISHQIGTIVCGYNRDFKRGLKLGKVTNQHFAQINLSYLRSTLKHLCERYGITYLEQEESYTSQASCLDLDNIPVYQLDAPYTGTFSGKRIRRGLYRFANGRTANADINGAANILRKSKQNFDFEELCKGLLDSPLRIRLS